MAKQIWKPGNMVYPLPAVMVSTGDKKGNQNILTVAWTGTVCTNPRYRQNILISFFISCTGIHISASGTLFLSYDRRKR